MTNADRPADSEATSAPQRRIRLAPIVGGVVFVVAAVVLARAATRLADIVGLVAFAAATSWLVTPLHRRVGRRIGSGTATVLLVLGGLAVSLTVGALLMRDLRLASDALVTRLERIDATVGNSWADRVRRSLRLGEGVSAWVSSLPGSVVADEAGGTAIGRRVVDLIVVVVLTGFFLAEGSAVVSAVVGRWPRDERERVWALARDIDHARRRLPPTWRAHDVVVRCGRRRCRLGRGASLPPWHSGCGPGFWLSVPTVGWVVAAVPLAAVALDASRLEAVVLVALVVGLAVGTRSLRRRRSAVLRPGAAVVTVCLAAGVAASGGALALLFVIAGVVAATVATSDIRISAAHADRGRPCRGARPGARARVVSSGLAWASGVLVATVVAATTIARSSSAVVWIVTALLIAVAAERPVVALARRAHVSRRVATAARDGGDRGTVHRARSPRSSGRVRRRHLERSLGCRWSSTTSSVHH